MIARPNELCWRSTLPTGFGRLSQLSSGNEQQPLMLCRASRWKVSVLAAVCSFCSIVLLIDVNTFAGLAAIAVTTPALVLLARNAIRLGPEGTGDQVRLVGSFHPVKIEPHPMVIQTPPYTTSRFVTFRRPDGKVRGVSLDFMRSNERRALLEELARRSANSRSH